MPVINVAIAGFGFMGQTHARCMALHPEMQVVGIADAGDAATARRAREIGLEVPVAVSLEQLLDEEDVAFVDLCLPTDLHRSQAEVAFARGKHVFCEKPLALTLADAEAMVEGAQRAGVFLMVGHCLRFWPEYRELERVVRGGELGPLLSLEMTRRAGRPGYTVGDWVADPARCVGAALDLHIHDADFLNHLFGLPPAVTSCGSLYPSGWDHISTIYHYDTCRVSAVGGWDHPASWGFRMEYHAVFEGGALDFDSSASPSLRCCESGGRPVPVPLPSTGVAAPAGCQAYAAELDYFAACIARGEPPQTATGAQAAQSLRLVLAEIESARTGRTVNL